MRRHPAAKSLHIAHYPKQSAKPLVIEVLCPKGDRVFIHIQLRELEMDTRFLLMARYDAIPVIPLERVRKDFFPHLSQPHFLRKLNDHAIPLPVIFIEPSQKSQRGVHLEDLAKYLDLRREAALKDFTHFHMQYQVQGKEKI